jgi:hypothetical protein
MPFAELERLHEAHLRESRATIDRLERLIFELVESLEECDQISLKDDVAVAEAHRIWSGWKQRAERAAEGVS